MVPYVREGAPEMSRHCPRDVGVVTESLVSMIAAIDGVGIMLLSSMPFKYALERHTAVERLYCS